MTDPQPPRAPDEPTPIEPAPVPLEPFEPAPSDQPPIEPAPSDQPPIEPAPSEPLPVEPPIPVEPPVPPARPAYEPPPVEQPAPPVYEPPPVEQPARPVYEPPPVEQPVRPVYEPPPVEQPAPPAAALEPVIAEPPAQTPADEPPVPSDYPPPLASGTPEAPQAYENAGEDAADAPVEDAVPTVPTVPTVPVDAPPLDAAATPTTSRRSRAWLPATALGLAVALLAGATGFLAWQLWQQKQSEDGRPDAVAAARDAARLLFSYNHETLEADFEKGLAVTTGGFRSEYGRTTKEVVTPVAQQYKAVVVAEVVEASVIDAEAGKVTALVFLNQGTTSTRVEGQQVDQSRVRMHLVERDGEWLVEAVEAL